MSSIPLGARSNIHIGFSGTADERHAKCLSKCNPIVHMRYLCFVISGFLFYELWRYDNLSPTVKGWLFIGSILTWAAIRFYESYNRIQANYQARRAAVNSLIYHTELRSPSPSSQGVITRERLNRLRIQVAMLERQFNALRMLFPRNRVMSQSILNDQDRSSNPAVPLMSQDEINALPIHKHKVTGSESQSSWSEEASVTSGPEEDKKGFQDQLVCNICMEQIKRVELVLTLPCSHKYHAQCIYKWFDSCSYCPDCENAKKSTKPQNSDAPRGDDMV